MLTQDEAELYDRQIRLWGVNAQARIRQSKVMMLGFNGVASEVAKILVLAGIDTLTIVDNQPLQDSDLASNLFCRPNKSNKCIDSANSEQDTIQFRTNEVKSKLKVLNPLVNVIIDNSPIESKTKADFKDYDLVTLHSFLPIDKIITIDNDCRSSKIKFYIVVDFGLFGFVFNDLGDEFKFTYEEFSALKDTEESKSRGSQKDPISLADEERTNGDPDDVGYGSSDDEDSRPKKRLRVDSPIRDTVVKEENTKETKVGTLNYAPFRDMILFKGTTLTKQTNPTLLISISMFKFFDQFKHLPRATNKEDISQLNEIIVSLKDSLELHDKVFERLDKEWSENIYGSLSPVCAVVGGIAGQDMIRALSNKDIPIINTFSFDGLSMNGTVEKVGLKDSSNNGPAIVRDLVQIDDDD